MKLPILCFLIFFVSTALADISTQMLEEKIKNKLPSFTVSKIQKSPVAGFYEVYDGEELFYFSEDSNFIFRGHLYSLEEAGVINLTALVHEAIDAEKAPERAAQLNQIDDKSKIIFKADNEKHVVHVLTDIDCGYCRKMHNEYLDEYLSKGITLKYLAFPRAGLHSSSAKKAATVWCSSDPNKALSSAKSVGIYDNVEYEGCLPIIDKHLAFVQKFGLSGTPSIITNNGALIKGLIDPEQLLAYLEKTK